jgi:predicted deacylase
VSDPRAAGIRQTVLRFEHPLLAGLEHPCFEAQGAADGPRVAITGGVHGCEYSSIAAVIRLMRELDLEQLSGSIVAVPVVSLESFRARSAFVVPADGENLNRAFPGSYDGGYTSVLARSLFDTLIAPADAYIDLHGGDLVEALEPFAIYDRSPVEEQSRALALAFGLPYVVRGPEAGGLDGMTCTAAAAAGVPAVIAEAGGCGRLEVQAVDLLVRGTRNALRSLGVLAGPVEPPAVGTRVVEEFLWPVATHEGWWAPCVAAGVEVTANSLLGRVLDLHGNVLEDVRAGADGVVLFLTTSPAVAAGGLLLGLGAEPSAV